MRSSRAPAVVSVTRGSNPGSSAKDAMVRSAPLRWTVVVVPSASRLWRATTSVPATSRPECTPGSGVSSSCPSGPQVHSPIDVGSSPARKSTTSPSTSSTSRTCSDGGVTASPSTTSLRAPSTSATVTSAPDAVWAGTPGTISTQARSVCSCRSEVAPVAGSTRSTRSARWFRGWTTTSRSWASHTACTRYSSRTLSQLTSVLVPSSLRICSDTRALAVPAAG